MNISRQIYNWARMIVESEEGETINESLKGDFTNTEAAEYLEKMFKMYGKRIVTAVYVNDKSFISKDYSVSDESVDFKSGDNRLNGENILPLKEMIDILKENSDKFCTFDGKRATEFDFDIEDSDGSYLPTMATEESANESEQFDKAKKIGYMGTEKDVEDWLKGDYAKWKQHCLDVFMRLTNGDEEKALKLFNYYDVLATEFVGVSKWDEETKKYISLADMKKNFEKKLNDEYGEDADVKEMMDKLEEKWKRDTKSLIDFYDSASSRGGWTGD